jgi:hypothetical protein
MTVTVVRLPRKRSHQVGSKEPPAYPSQQWVLDRLKDIAERLRLLRPEGHDPNKYHEDKSELLRDIGRLRADIRSGALG